MSFLTDGRHGICTTGGYDLFSLILRNRFFIGLHRWLDTHALYLNRTTAFLIYWCVVCALYNIWPRLHRSSQVQNGRLTVVFYGIVLFPHIDDMANSPHSRYVTRPAIQSIRVIQLYGPVKICRQESYLQLLLLNGFNAWRKGERCEWSSRNTHATICSVTFKSKRFRRQLIAFGKV